MRDSKLTRPTNETGGDSRGHHSFCESRHDAIYRRISQGMFRSSRFVLHFLFPSREGVVPSTYTAPLRTSDVRLETGVRRPDLPQTPQVASLPFTRTDLIHGRSQLDFFFIAIIVVTVVIIIVLPPRHRFHQHPTTALYFPDFQQTPNNAT